MSKSPGHQAHPDHKVQERPLDQRMRVEIAGQVLAESGDVIRVEEDGNPPRLYFRREDVRMERLEPSATTSRCPFKGTARYFSIRLDGRLVPDAVWSYEEPYDEHRGLAGRLAFYDDKFRDIHIAPAAGGPQG